MNFYTDNESLAFYLHHPEMEQVVAACEKGFAEAGQHPEAPATTEEAVAQYEMAMNLLGGIAGDVIAPNAEAVDHEGPKLEGGRVQYAPGTRRNLDALIQAGLYGVMTGGLLVWVILLMVIGLKEMNEYSVAKALLVVLLTVFTMAVIWATIVLLFTISSQFVTMIREVYYEIIYRL